MHEQEFITDVLRAVSAEEKRKILARTWRGKIQGVRSGHYYASNPPFGYRTENGMLYVTEAEAAVVRRMFEMALGGGTIGRIASQLTADRVPSPMAMRGDIVRQGKKWRRLPSPASSTIDSTRATPHGTSVGDTLQGSRSPSRCPA